MRLATGNTEGAFVRRYGLRIVRSNYLPRALPQQEVAARAQAAGGVAAAYRARRGMSTNSLQKYKLVRRARLTLTRRAPHARTP